MELDQEIRVARNAMIAAMGDGFSDTPESLTHEKRLRELESMRQPRARQDIIGDVYLRAFA